MKLVFQRDQRAPLRGRLGSVLIVVLWVCFGLVAMTLYFGHAMNMELRASDNELAGRQAEQAVEGGARYALSLLRDLETPGQLPLPDAYLSERVPLDEARFWFIGRTDDLFSLDRPAFGLTDEAAKLNLNTATRAMLEKLPNMTSEFAAAIIDWRDEDSEVTQGGAENETYGMGSLGYECKNALFESVEELLLVHGAEEWFVLGEDANSNGILDPNEDDGDLSPPSDNRNGVLDFGLVDYLTVFTREPAGDGGGDTALVDVSSGGGQELRALLEENLAEDRVNEILQRLSGAQSFQSLLEFFIRSQMTEEEFEQIADRLTVSSESARTGLVNVNTASAAVLACVPGIDAAKAEQLVAQRRTQSEPSTSVAWAAEILGAEGAAQAGPYLAARSHQATADVAAVGRHGRGYRRARFVIDFSEGEPRVIFRKDLRSKGWALGMQEYEEVRLVMEQEARR